MLVSESKELKFYHVQPGEVFASVHSSRAKHYTPDGSEELYLCCQTLDSKTKEPIKAVVNIKTGKLEEAFPTYQLVRLYRNAVLNLNDF